MFQFAEAKTKTKHKNTIVPCQEQFVAFALNIRSTTKKNGPIQKVLFIFDEI